MLEKNYQSTYLDVCRFACKENRIIWWTKSKKDTFLVSVSEQQGWKQLTPKEAEATLDESSL